METEKQNVLLGALIRQRRIDLNMTQEELGGNIYSASQISRIESGQSFPDYDKLQKLLQTLGLEDDLFYGLRNQTGMKITLLQEEILRSCIHFQHTVGNDRRINWSNAMRCLNELEDMVSNSDHITQQFIIHCKIVLGREEGVPYTPQEELAFLLKAIRLTVPRFDIEKINDSLYYFNEIKIINHIALSYSHGGDHETANDIFRQLIKYIETHNHDVHRSAGYLPLVAHNYSRELAISGRYKEAIKIGEKGWRHSLKYKHYTFLGSLLHTMAGCYHFLGNNKTSMALFQLAYDFYQIVNDQKNIALIKIDAREYCGIELTDYCSMWFSEGQSSPSGCGCGETPDYSIPSLSEFW